METKKPFWTWVFCESDGTPSFSRVFTGVIVAFSLGWVTHIVWKSHSLPDFAGLALFVTVLYGANGLKTWAVAKANNPTPTDVKEGDK